MSTYFLILADTEPEMVTSNLIISIISRPKLVDTGHIWAVFPFGLVDQQPSLILICSGNSSIYLSVMSGLIYIFWGREILILLKFLF